MGSSPERPCDDVSGLDASFGETCGETSDFLNRPSDQCRGGLSLMGRFFGASRRWRNAGSQPSWRRPASRARRGDASQCQERGSLWSSPSSFFAVSKLSSIAQRCPSTLTRVRVPVPAGHQVEKKARSSSAMVRRIRSPRVQRPLRSSSYSAASRVGQFAIGPIEQPRAFRAVPGRQAFPGPKNPGSVRSPQRFHRAHGPRPSGPGRPSRPLGR